MKKLKNEFFEERKDLLSKNYVYRNHINKFVKYLNLPDVQLSNAPARMNINIVEECIRYYHDKGELNSRSTLIHMGYMAYDSKTKKVFIPNDEVRSTFLRAIRNDGWEEVVKAVSASEALLKATLAMDEKAVAQMIQEVHMQNSSSLIYNNEISLSSVIALAYYSACRDYTLVRELPAGNGFADMVLLPKRTSINPALVLELKWNKTAEGAISQIKKKEYVAALKEYKGNILLVGINYEKKSKKHQCMIEKVEI